MVGRKKGPPPGASLCPSMMMDPALSSVKAHKTLWRTTRTTECTEDVDVDDDVDDSKIFPITGEGRRSVLRRFALRRTSGTGENARASVCTTWRGEEETAEKGSSDPQGEEEYEEDERRERGEATEPTGNGILDERPSLEIVKKTISKKKNQQGRYLRPAHPPPSLNGRRLSGENEPPRRASEDEEREREKC